MDETWVHYFTPKTKEQSKQWIEGEESSPKKAKTVPSASKVMASIFLDTHKIIFIGHLQKGKKFNGEYYANLLWLLKDEIKKNVYIWRKRKCCFIKTVSAHVYWLRFENHSHYFAK